MNEWYRDLLSIQIGFFEPIKRRVKLLGSGAVVELEGVQLGCKVTIDLHAIQQQITSTTVMKHAA